MAAAQLPLLRLMDCGKSICANPKPEAGRSYFGDLTGGIKFCSKLPTQKKQQPTYQKLIIKHSSLKKLSLWGCSAIEVSVEKLYAIVNTSWFWLVRIVKLCAYYLFHMRQALYVNCPELVDLNLNSCMNLHPGAFRMQYSPSFFVSGF